MEIMKIARWNELAKTRVMLLDVYIIYMCV